MGKSASRTWSTTGDLNVRQDLNGKRIKSVKFTGRVYVILIPSIAEYERCGVADLLWWRDEDHQAFKAEALEELKHFMEVNRITDCKTAIHKLYFNPEPESLPQEKQSQANNLELPQPQQPQQPSYCDPSASPPRQQSPDATPIQEESSSKDVAVSDHRESALSDDSVDTVTPKFETAFLSCDDDDHHLQKLHSSQSIRDHRSEQHSHQEHKSHHHKRDKSLSSPLRTRSVSDCGPIITGQVHTMQQLDGSTASSGPPQSNDRMESLACF